jgi:hypothetical protein
VWIDRGVITKEQERQAERFGKGTLLVEDGKDMMERAEETHKKHRQMAIANEEAVQSRAQKRTNQTRIPILPQPRTIRQSKIHKRKISGRTRFTSPD